MYEEVEEMEAMGNKIMGWGGVGVDHGGVRKRGEL